MKLLTRIRLINWHYLTDLDLEVKGSMYLFGENESGKSSILDALQFALVADLRRIRFNASARGGERTERTLEGYVRCQVGDNLYLRDNAVGYVALEFKSEYKNEMDGFVIGGIIESHAGSHTQHGFFIFNHASLNDKFFLDEARRPYSLSQFRAKTRNLRGCKYYPDAGEYQDDLRNRMGQLNRRFADLFVKAFAFKPETNIRNFIGEYILDKNLVSIETMRQTRERYEELSQFLKRVEEQIEALQKITKADEERASAKRLLELHSYIIRRAEFEQAKANGEQNKNQQAKIDNDLKQLSLELAHTEERERYAQQELDETQRALNNHALYVQRQQWERDKERLEREKATAERQRKRILDELKSEQRFLDKALTMLGAVSFDISVGDVEAVRQFFIWLEGLPDNLEQDRPRGIELMKATYTALKTLKEWAIGETAKIKHDSDQVKKEMDSLNKELERLRRGGKPEPPDTVKKLRELLKSLGEFPYFYEFLEIPDETWQNAVEGILGNNRFNLLIDPNKFEECIKLYESERLRQNIHGVRLVDLKKVGDDKRKSPSSPTKQRSLVLQVKVKPNTPPLINDYLNSLLSNWVTCNEVTELRQYAQAVTRTCMTYSHYAIDNLDPKRYQDWFIGSRAPAQRIKQLEAELEEQRQTYLELHEHWQKWTERVKAVEPSDNYTRWIDALTDLPDLAQLLEELADLTRKLEETNWSDIQALHVKIKQLKEERDRWQREAKSLSKQQGERESEQRNIQARRYELEQQIAQREERLKELEAGQSPEQVQEWQGRHQKVAQQNNFEWWKMIANYTTSRTADETNLNNARNKISEQQIQYNNTYSFPALIDPDEVSPYQQELNRLAGSELPQYREEIEKARLNADQEFKEHFIHSMREKIQEAQFRLGEMNEALRNIDFSGTVYRFKADPNETFKNYYDLIMDQDSSTMGLPLLQGDFLEKYQDVLRELADKLLGRGGVTPHEVESLCDYREYLTYDIELKREGERWERLSKVGGLQSGGKTQAPYYVAMVAAFAQLYRIENHHNNNTIRLVVFDEAFNRMDRTNTQRALELMHRYKLQVITATPPKRFDEIAPFVETSFYIERNGTQVVAVPYRHK